MVIGLLCSICSKNKGIKLKEGKIALVDNGGNVFHANLEYKGKQKK